MVDLALDTLAGLVPDLGGPRVYAAAEMFRAYLRVGKRRRPILPVWLPGEAARAIRAVANLAPDGAAGRRTWEDFLAESVSSPSAGSSVPT